VHRPPAQPGGPKRKEGRVLRRALHGPASWCGTPPVRWSRRTIWEIGLSWETGSWEIGLSWEGWPFLWAATHRRPSSERSNCIPTSRKPTGRRSEAQSPSP